MSAKILLVEDDIYLREGLNELLIKEGYEPFCAGSCKEGKRLFESTVFDLAILDVMLGGGSVFVGNIEASDSATGSANLRVDSGYTGKAAGKITVTYEDDFGKEYKQTVDLSTVIEEKIEAAISVEEKNEKKYPLWWLFILIGVTVGGGAGFGVTWYINDKKQRKEDDLRL